jgi:chaperone LolA
VRALAIAVFLVPAIASASPEQTLADVQASYANVKHLQGSFTQTFVNATFGKTDHFKGNVYLVRPDKMRWDYSQPNKKGKSIIFDSKTLWIVEPENLQIYKHSTVDPTLPAAISFLNGGKQLATDFTVTTPRADTLVLVPKKANVQIKQLTFVIDAKTKRVVKSIVVNQKDDSNTFEFRVAEQQPDAKLFTFSPKRVPGYKVIDVAAE